MAPGDVLEARIPTMQPASDQELAKQCLFYKKMSTAPFVLTPVICDKGPSDCMYLTDGQAPQRLSDIPKQ